MEESSNTRRSKAVEQSMAQPTSQGLGDRSAASQTNQSLEEPGSHFGEETVVTEISSVAANERPMGERPMFERHWSTSNLSSNGAGPFLQRGTNGRQQSTPVEVTSSVSTTGTDVDFAMLHASWANTDGSDIFGSAAPFRPQADLHGSSYASMSSMSSIRLDPTSGIHDAARITDWDKVLDLCASNPEYAQYSGVDGWTALHHACNRRCPRPEVAEALIKAYPDALLAEEEKGWNPLHYACRFKAPKAVVKLLLYMDPEKGKISVSRKDRQGRTPLYYAVRYDAPPGVVGLLLEVNPSAVLEEDQNEESPLALVWNTWADKLEGKRVIRSFLPGGFPEPEGVTEEERTKLLWDKLRSQPKVLKRWKQVNVLLKAAFGFPVEEEKGAPKPAASIGSERKWRIVHATAAVKVHLSLFLLACALHPEQARELDESDLRRPSDPMLTGVSTHQTALHLAASSNAEGEAGKIVIQDLVDLFRNAAHVQDAIDGSLPLHRLVENEYKQDWQNFGSILCHVYPRALQIPDHNGKLPLHRAAAITTHSKANDANYTNTSVIMNVVRLFPQAASHLDNGSCLPFHILSMNAEIWDDNLESVYNAHRGAAQTRTGPSLDNRLPIHLATSSERAAESLISRLVRLHPRGVSVPDRQGKLPCHLGAEIGREWDDGLGVVYEAFPAAIEQAEGNARGWLPLHMVAHCERASAGLIVKLVGQYPAAASVADKDGRYPLHLACDAGKGWDTGLETLFNACPSSLAAADKSGLLPLHISALRYCAGASSVAEGNDEEDSTAELEILYQLLRADPSVI